MKIKIILFFLITLFYQIGITKSQDFEVAPIKLDFSAEPGEAQTKTVTIKNHGNKKSSMILSLNDFLPSNEGGIEYLPANSTNRSFANWININPAFFELNPGEEKVVSISMQIPIDDYTSKWGVIFVQTTKEQSPLGVDEGVSAGIMLSPRIAIKVFQSPGTNQNYAIKIGNMEEITVPGDNNRIFSVNVENIGDKITKCKIHLIASNLSTTEETQYPAQTATVFPKTYTKVKLTLPSDLIPGNYSLAAIIDYPTARTLEGTQMLIEVK